MFIPCISRETSLIMDKMSTILRGLDVCCLFLDNINLLDKKSSV